MSPFKGPNAVWWKILVAVLPILAGAIVAFTRVQSSVGQLERSVEAKADRAVVEANQQAILRELERIHNAVEDLRRQGSR